MQSAELQVDLVVPSQTKYLTLIGNIGEQIAKELDGYKGDREAFAYHLNLVLTEAITNAIKHSSSENPLDTVKLTVQIKNDELVIRVFDHGQGFDLESVPLPDLEHPQEGGMGLFLIKTLMDSVTYNKTTEGNILEIRKSLK